MANFVGKAATSVRSQGGSGINEYIAEQLDPALSWDDVKWLLSFTKLPVIVKGILTREDALIAADLGVQGIFVSNHGARQVDSVPASVSLNIVEYFPSGTGTLRSQSSVTDRSTTRDSESRR